MKKSNLFLTLALMSIAFLVGSVYSDYSDAKCQTLEVYTPKDIYYINGLKVTSESGIIDVSLRSHEELKYFISELTAQDTNEAEAITQGRTAKRYFDFIGEPYTDDEHCTFIKVVYNDFSECVEL